MRIASALIIAALLADPPAPRAPAPWEASAATPFELTDQGGVVVPAVLNGRGPFRLLIDTGSTHSAVSEAVAIVTGAEVVARAIVGSAVGEDERIVVRIDRLACGPLMVADVRPSVVDLRGVDPSGRIDGVIGQDVLASLRFAIDFRRRRVVWWPEPAQPEADRTLPLEESQGRFLVSLPQRASVLRLVPDSGAGTLVLFERALDRLPGVTLLPGVATLTAMTAAGTVRRATVSELRVGQATLRRVPAVVASEGRTSEPVEGDGLLPLHLFGLVTFDGPGRRLVVDARGEGKGDPEGLMFF